MKIFVENINNGAKGLLVGSGYGMFASSTPGAFLGNLAPDEREGAYGMICMTNTKGALIWDRSENYRVVLIDGAPPQEQFAEILAEAKGAEKSSS